MSVCLSQRRSLFGLSKLSLNRREKKETFKTKHTCRNAHDLVISVFINWIIFRCHL